MHFKWLWLTLPILVLARPGARPEDCEDPEGSGRFDASPSRGKFSGSETSGQHLGNDNSNELYAHGSALEPGSPANEDPGYSPEGAGYDPESSGHSSKHAGFNFEGSGYNPNDAGHNPESAGHNLEDAGYDFEGAEYKPQGSSYNPENSDYNPESSDYNPEGSSYNPEGAGYNPDSAGYNPDDAGYNPESSGYSPDGAGHNPKASGPEPWTDGNNFEPSVEFHDYSPSFEFEPEEPSYEFPAYFPNTPQPWPYNTYTTTPFTTPFTSSTPTSTISQPTTSVTFFRLLASGSVVVPDGSMLSDVQDGLFSQGVAIFDDGDSVVTLNKRASLNNSNSIFMLDDLSNLVDVATGEVANVSPNVADAVQPLAFNLPADIANDGSISCICNINQITLVLTCNCGNGYVYFQTNSFGNNTTQLLVGQQQPSVDQSTYASVTVVVDYTIPTLTTSPVFTSTPSDVFTDSITTLPSSTDIITTSTIIIPTPSDISTDITITSPFSPSFTSTSTSAPAPTIFGLRSEGSQNVPDGTTLSLQGSDGGESLAVFDNGNGAFTLDENGRLIEVVTGQIANVDYDGTAQILFDTADVIAEDGDKVCACIVRGPDTTLPTLACNCGGSTLFQTDVSGLLYIAQSPSPGFSNVTITVDYGF